MKNLNSFFYKYFTIDARRVGTLKKPLESEGGVGIPRSV